MREGAALMRIRAGNQTGQTELSCGRKMRRQQILKADPLRIRVTGAFARFYRVRND